VACFRLYPWSVEIVIGQLHLGAVGGAETYVLTVAEQLQGLGHGVTVFSLELGQSAALGLERGLEIRGSEDELPEACDIVLANDSVTAYRLAEHYPTAAMVFVVHADEYDLSVPPQVPEVVHERMSIGRSRFDQVDNRPRRGHRRECNFSARARIECGAEHLATGLRRAAASVTGRCWRERQVLRQGFLCDDLLRRGRWRAVHRQVTGSTEQELLIAPRLLPESRASKRPGQCSPIPVKAGGDPVRGATRE